MLTYCGYYSLYMVRTNLNKNTAILYCHHKLLPAPHTVWPFLVQHQADDRYTKCTEHLHTLSSDNAACANTTVACQIYVV